MSLNNKKKKKKTQFENTEAKQKKNTWQEKLKTHAHISKCVSNRIDLYAYVVSFSILRCVCVCVFLTLFHSHIANELLNSNSSSNSPTYINEILVLLKEKHFVKMKMFI